MQRIVQPELLDQLPPGDEGAIGSRRDLRRLNAIMGNVDILAAMLLKPGAKNPPRRIIELGAGEGVQSLRLAKKLARHWPSTQFLLVDIQDVVTSETRDGFKALGWKIESVKADIFDWLRWPSAEPADFMYATIFLHHFQTSELAKLLRLASERAHWFAACEPRRSPLAYQISRLAGFIGCNSVTQHDAPVSVKAGFNGNELSRLWPDNADWQITEHSARLFTHVFSAKRASTA